MINSIKINEYPKIIDYNYSACNPNQYVNDREGKRVNILFLSLIQCYENYKQTKLVCSTSSLDTKPLWNYG